jgi:hypothetical protein
MIERRTWTAIPGLLFLAIGAVVLSAYSGASSSKNRSPVQPIAFPHPTHVVKLGMNCMYCHYTANKSPDPGLPAVSTCMGCHAFVGPKRPKTELGPERISKELQKLYMYAGVAGDSLQAFSGTAMGSPTKLGPNAKPIPWVRIHKLPEYVRFPHMRHVNAAVTCQSCHGKIQEMTQVYQAESLNMGWCVSCHVNGYTVKQGLDAAGYSPPTGPPAGSEISPAVAAALARDTTRKHARYDCANCHY